MSGVVDKNKQGDISAFTAKVAEDIRVFKDSAIGEALTKRTNKTTWKQSIIQKFLSLQVDDKNETYYWQGKKLIAFAKQPRFEMKDGKFEAVVDTTLYD